jgi:hypothetical protein
MTAKAVFGIMMVSLDSNFLNGRCFSRRVSARIITPFFSLKIQVGYKYLLSCKRFPCIGRKLFNVRLFPEFDYTT